MRLDAEKRVRRPDRSTWSRAAVTVMGALGSAAVLAACSSPVSIAGTWSASDGSPMKVIGADGTCTGMYYSGNRVLDIGGPETCALSSKEVDGYYSLVVRQAPNEITYQVAIEADTMTLMTGGTAIVTLTRS